MIAYLKSQDQNGFLDPKHTKKKEGQNYIKQAYKRRGLNFGSFSEMKDKDTGKKYYGY